MAGTSPIRWGIVSTANIARASFLPGLRAAGGGTAYAVAGRNLARAERYAADNGIERAVEGYATLLADDQVDAVYIPLPNTLHAEWTIAALRAGKAVLCEKPLCVTAEETEGVLQVARETGRPLWEAFVFPFRDQSDRLQGLLKSGAIGEVREVDANFFFPMRSRENIRLDPQLGGGALYDVGCYPIRLARMVFGADPASGAALARWAPEGVDEEMQGLLAFPGERRLLFSCGMFRAPDTLARVLGTAGQIHLANPYHPGPNDTLEVRTNGGAERIQASGEEPSFTPAIRHIHAVLRGEEEPRHLAVDEALGNAQAIDLLYRSAQTGQLEEIGMGSGEPA